MAQRIDAATMRRWNKATVLNCVRAATTTSRIEIAETIGLNRATVSSLVDELIAEQFVREIGYGDSKGGRKPILLEFNADAAFTVGLDVQITHVTTTLCNIDGTVHAERTVPMSALNGDVRKNLLALIVQEASALIERAPDSPQGVLGVGVALPGMVNFQTGHVYMLPNMGVVEWDLCQQLQEQFGLPVFVDNDANCGAWAAYNRATDLKNLVYVNAGIGVGVGLVMDGQLYRGRDGVSGEYGHTTISAMGIPCACGNYGCWERYCCEESLVRYLRESGVTREFKETGSDFVRKIIAQADAGRDEYVHALHMLAQYLGLGIANIVNTVNPDALFLGGHLSLAHQHLMPQIELALELKAIHAARKTPVHIAPPDSVAIGAAGIAMSETLFSSIRL